MSIRAKAARRFISADGHFSWRLAAGAVAALTLLPLAAITVLATSPSSSNWEHLTSAILPYAAGQTLILMAGVAAITLVIGAGTAWLVTMYNFPGRNILEWALILPLAMPTYITAYCYGEFLDYTGPLQSALRALFGFRTARDYWFPDWRSVGGAIFIMSSVLYPYVYLMARTSFRQQSACTLEAARTLGRTASGAFFAVALPLARPALAAGVALALMECVNDIGAVEFLGVKTVTVAIYAGWVQRSDLGGAAQLALVMIAFVLLLVVLERWARTRQRFFQTARRHRPAEREQLGRFCGWLAALICLLPVLCGFAVPFAVLLSASMTYTNENAGASFGGAALHSLTLAGFAVFSTVILAWLVSFVVRLVPTAGMRASFRLAGLGYAIPGTVIALGTLIPFAALDNGIDALMRQSFGLSTGLLFSGSIFALVFAYTVRFMAVALGAIDSGYQHLSPNIDAAARTLGSGVKGMLLHVHLPLLRPAVAAAALLVFVDSMKELPATLLLRPFNFETLSTQIYIFASLEQFERAALEALTIVVIGLIPVILLLNRSTATWQQMQEKDSSLFSYRQP